MSFYLMEGQIEVRGMREEEEEEGPHFGHAGR